MKHRIVSLLLPFTFVLMLCGCINCINGTGTESSETRTVQDFHSIHLQYPAQMKLIPGSSGKVLLYGDSGVLSELSTTVENGILTIKTKRCIRNASDLYIEAYLQKLQQLKISGSAEVFADEMLSSEDASIRVSGSGTLNLPITAQTVSVHTSGSARVSLQGKARRLNLEVSGSGDISALDFPVEQAFLDISGSANCKLWVESLLDVQASGSGLVRYRGKPQIRTDISGSAKIIPIGNFSFSTHSPSFDRIRFVAQF